MKLMTANVWADVFGNPVPGRDTALARMIGRRHPDAVFFQEMHPHWWASQLSPLLYCMGYRRVEPDLGGNSLNYTPLYYDNNRYEALACGFHKYTGLNDYDSKSVTWALLIARDTRETHGGGKLCGVMSTHLYHEQNQRGNAARLHNVRELLDCDQAVRKAACDLCALDEETAGQMAVFCGGDYNCDLLSEPYAYLEAHGMVSAARLAVRKINDICTWHAYPVYDKVRHIYHSTPSDMDNVYSIDHICVRGRAAVDSYTVVCDPETFTVSDHCAVEVEVRL